MEDLLLLLFSNISNGNFTKFAKQIPKILGIFLENSIRTDVSLLPNF